MRPLCIDLFCGLGGWTEGFLAEGWNVVGFDIERHRYPEFNVERDTKGFGGTWFHNAETGKTNPNRSRTSGGVPTGRWKKYPAQLVIQDVLTIHGSQFRNADIIVASPPCQQYSWLAMPWSRSKDPNNSKAAKALRARWEAEGPDNRLFDACFRIQREAIYARRLELRCCPLDFSLPGCKRCHIPLIVENVRGAQEWVGRAPWNYGSFYLWGDVPALMPIGVHRKRTGRNFHTWELTDGAVSSPSFHGAYHETRGVGLGTTEGVKQLHTRGDNQTCGKYRMGLGSEADGLKIGGDWFSDPNSTCQRHGSKSNARKAASAMIAKIPLPLSTHIARVYWPIDLPRPVATPEAAGDTSGPASVPELPVSA